MHCLEIELRDRLRRNAAHPGTLHRFGNGLGVSEHGRSIPLATMGDIEDPVWSIDKMGNLIEFLGVCRRGIMACV